MRFNRSFTQMLLPERCLRLSPLMDENMLLATGAANARELYSAAGFFEALGTQYSLDFESRYIEQMGPTAPAISVLVPAISRASRASFMPRWLIWRTLSARP